MAKWKVSPGDWFHVEFLTGDTEWSKRFYGSVFVWEFEAIPGVYYVNVRTSEDGR